MSRGYLYTCKQSNQETWQKNNDYYSAGKSFGIVVCNITPILLVQAKVILDLKWHRHDHLLQHQDRVILSPSYFGLSISNKVEEQHHYWSTYGKEMKEKRHQWPEGNAVRPVSPPWGETSFHSWQGPHKTFLYTNLTSYISIHVGPI